jgi:cytochrome c
MVISCQEKKPEVQDIKKNSIDSNAASSFEKPSDNNRGAILAGLKVINGSNCKNCHNKSIKAIGPSYLQIATKYAFDSTAIPYLTKKVINGGDGVWGQVAMAAHPELSPLEAEQAVRYIMSLQ